MAEVLAVVAFATAVKDMVELAEKIHASFEKVGDNLRNAQMLASEIRQTIYELKKFCQRNHTTLNDDEELRGALLEVIAKLRLFYSDTVPLIPSESPRLLGRVKSGLKAWKNNDRIEASIRELKEEMKKCQTNFVVMSVARIQVKLNEMHRSTSEGLHVIQQGVSDLLFAQNPIVSFPLHSPPSPGQNLLQPSNHNIIAFAQTSSSTSTPLWKTPSAIKEQIIRDTRLNGQVDRTASIKKDQKRAIELAEQSVKLMEDINGIDSLPPSYEKVDGVVEVSNLFLTRLYQTSPSDQAIADYARALRELSNCLIADNQQQASLDAKLRALPIFHMLSLLAEDMGIELAGILYELISQKCKSLLPSEKVLKYADDCVRIYRGHAELNASMYGWYLCDALWKKANALNALSRDSDALEVWREVAETARQMIQDKAYYADALYQVSWSFRRLKRFEEAASVRTQSVLTYEAINNTTTASQANGHYDLCIDYQLAGMFPEAVDAARKAVDQYRVLAFAEPKRWTPHIGHALAALADSLFSAGEHDAALNEGYESIQIFERHTKTDGNCVQAYICSLRVNITLAVTVNNERKAIERMDDVLRHMRQLVTNFPEEVNLFLLEAELHYGHNLDRLDHIQEAQKYFEELIARWEVEEHPHVDKEAFENLHIGALISYASILDNQGHADLALVPIQKGTDIGKPLSAGSPLVAGQTVGAMYRHAHLLVELGRYAEALVVAEETLQFNRATKMDNASHLVGTLHVVGLAASHTHAYGRVVEVSQEAVDICKHADFEEHCQRNPGSFCLLSCSLQLLSSGHADSGNLELGLKYGQQAVDDAKALRVNLRVASADVEQYYMEANDHLGVMYLANGKVDAARGTFEETRAYFTEKVKERNGHSGSLISILRRLGIIYCSEGKHDEGHATAQEAKKYLDHLAKAFPGLHKLVHIDMRHELPTPSLQALNRMKEKLSCDHQAELAF